jgi:hypothetical protein
MTAELKQEVNNSLSYHQRVDLIWQKFGLKCMLKTAYRTHLVLRKMLEMCDGLGKWICRFRIIRRFQNPVQSCPDMRLIA